MTGISTALNLNAVRAGLIIAAVAAALPSMAASEASAQAGASQAGMAAAQSAVRDAREQTQRRLRAGRRLYHQRQSFQR
jgi:hypothetical protein